MLTIYIHNSLAVAKIFPACIYQRWETIFQSGSQMRKGFSRRDVENVTFCILSLHAYFSFSLHSVSYFSSFLLFFLLPFSLFFLSFLFSSFSSSS